MEKTNAMRILDKQKIFYREYNYNSAEVLSGVEVARILKQDVNRVFKTLVTTSKSGKIYVFVIPVNQELDLKKAARVVNEKSIIMLKSKDLLSLTGYIHGGCSPVGMKKKFKTVFDISVLNQDTVIFSGGKIGHQVEVNVKDLPKIIAWCQWQPAELCQR